MTRSLVAGSLLLAALAAGAPAQEPGFKSEVAPILARRCVACHSDQKSKGEYRLHTFAALGKPGESKLAPLTAGKPADSHLLSLVTSQDVAERMPKDAPPLAAAEIEVLKRWIAAGAKFDGPAPEAELVSYLEWKHPEPPAAYAAALPITAVAFSPDGKELAVGGLYEVTVWDPAGGSLLRRLRGLAERTYSLAYAPDGKSLAVGGGAPGQLGEVRLIDPADGRLIRHFGSAADCMLKVAFRPDGQQLAAVGADNRLRVWQVSDGKPVFVSRDHSDWVLGVAWSPDGKKIATASRDRTCKVFSAADGKLLTTYAEHGQPVYGVGFLPDGSQAASCAADGKVHLWLPEDPGYEDKEMKKKKKQQMANLSAATAEAFDLLVAGDKAFVGLSDKSVRPLDLAKKATSTALPGHEEWVLSLAWHPESQRLAAGALDGKVCVWSLAEAKSPPAPPTLVFIAAPGLAAR